MNAGKPSASPSDPILSPMKKDCTVSIVGQDGQTYSLEVEASSVFDAADQAVQSWARLWWYEPNAVLEVRAGDQLWKIRAGRVREWKAAKEQR